MKELNVASSIGFRHVIEDGLSILSDEGIDSDRRKYVLDDLINLLEQAKKGADLIKGHELFVGSDERDAFETYRLLERNLSVNWNEKLDEAKCALDNLKNNSDLSVEMRGVAISLFKELHTRIEQQSSMGIPREPEEINII